MKTKYFVCPAPDFVDKFYVKRVDYSLFGLVTTTYILYRNVNDGAIKRVSYAWRETWPTYTGGEWTKYYESRKEAETELQNALESFERMAKRRLERQANLRNFLLREKCEEYERKRN